MIVRNKRISLIVLLVFLVCSCLLSISVGAIEIPIKNLVKIIGNQLFSFQVDHYPKQQEAVLLAIRAPRVLVGALIGAALSVAGCAVQGMFRNPLAEPGLIGVSSGASLFAVTFIVLGNSLFHSFTLLFGYYALSIAAFTGAFLTTWLLYRFAVSRGKVDISSLLLMGIAINALAAALTGILTYIATDEQLRNITFWSLGSLGGANWKTLMVLLPFSLLCMLGLLPMGKVLNAMALGEAQAEHLGINIRKVNKWIVIFAALGVGSSVAMAGVIGFLALLVPHLLRISVSADHKFLLPASGILGAALLVLADLIARTIVVPAELPIGILTAFMGVPMFIMIILKSKRERSII